MKREIGVKNYLGPVLVTLVGADVDESCLTGDKVDFAKVRPFYYGNYSNDYWDLGKVFAQAYSIGKELKE